MDLGNKKMLRFCMLVLVLTIIIAAIFMGCGEDAIPSKIIDKDDISKTYTDNLEKFKLVAEFLQNVKEDVYIEKLEDNKFSIKKSEDGEIKTFDVTDEKIKGAIEYILNKLNYKYINEYGENGIYFTRQTSLRFSQGIAYSKDSDKPDWGTIEELEHISGNWYYYKGY